MVLNLAAAPDPAIVQMVVDTANRYGVPPQIALGVASHESGFNPSATNLNSNGTTDWGVMQLNDTTVKTLGVQNPLDPQQNINAGVSLLASYYQKYGDWNLALQAYAGGPGSVGLSNSAQGLIAYVDSYGGPGLDQTLVAADQSGVPPDSSQPAPSTDWALAAVIAGALIAGIALT